VKPAVVAADVERVSRRQQAAASNDGSSGGGGGIVCRERAARFIGSECGPSRVWLGAERLRVACRQLPPRERSYF